MDTHHFGIPHQQIHIHPYSSSLFRHSSWSKLHWPRRSCWYRSACASYRYTSLCNLHWCTFHRTGMSKYGNGNDSRRNLSIWIKPWELISNKLLQRVYHPHHWLTCSQLIASISKQVQWTDTMAISHGDLINFNYADSFLPSKCTFAVVLNVTILLPGYPLLHTWVYS